MNKLSVLWFKHKQDILVGLFCMFLISFGAKGSYETLTGPNESSFAWIGFMIIVIGASMALGVAINKISIREQKKALANNNKVAKSTRKSKNEI